MAESFDPYHRWLGISPKDQPPNHYRLLGVDPFESDPDVIADAADRQMAHVRSHQAGKHSQWSQQILNEIAAARVCLLSPEKKGVYDKQLRRELRPTAPPVPPTGNQHVGTPAPAAVPVQPGSAAPLPAPGPVATATFPPTPSRGQPWPLYAALGAVAAVLVVVLAVLLFGPGSKEAAHSNLERRFAEEPARVPEVNQSGSVKPQEPPRVPPTEKLPAETISAEEPTSTGPAEPLPPEPPPAEATGAGNTEREPPHDQPTPAVSPATQGPGTASLPPDAEEQLKRRLAGAETRRDYREVAEQALRYVDQAIVAANADAARKLAVLAVSAAREAKDDELAKTATLRYLGLQGALSESMKDEARKRLHSLSED